MNLLHWSQQRNRQWARTKLTVRKYEKIQKTWARITRVGPLLYFFITAAILTLVYFAISLTTSYFLGTFDLVRRQCCPEFFREYLLNLAEFSFAISVIFAAAHVFAAWQFSLLPRPLEPETDSAAIRTP